jgi:hypothetical protein
VIFLENSAAASAASIWSARGIRRLSQSLPSSPARTSFSLERRPGEQKTVVRRHGAGLVYGVAGPPGGAGRPEAFPPSRCRRPREPNPDATPSPSRATRDSAADYADGARAANRSAGQPPGWRREATGPPGAGLRVFPGNQGSGFGNSRRQRRPNSPGTDGPRPCRPRFFRRSSPWSCRLRP